MQTGEHQTTGAAFQERLRKGEVAAAVKIAIAAAVELEITTWVASPEQVDTPLPGQRLRTRINIVEGHIENEVGSQFLNNGPYADLQAFHLQQVRESSQAIQSNLESLKALFEAWIGTQQSS